jgi:hypothetical protein
MNRPISIEDDRDWAACQPDQGEWPVLKAIKEDVLEFHHALDRGDPSAIKWKEQCEANHLITLGILNSML